MTNSHPRRRRILYVALTVAALTAAALAVAAGVALAHGIPQHESRTVGTDALDGAPSALHLDPSRKRAADVAEYVMRIYSETAAGGAANPHPRLDWAPEWQRTYDADLLATALAAGADIEGGTYGEATVASSEELRPGRYRVTLDVQRTAQTITLESEGIEVVTPAAEFHPVILLSHTDAHWRVGRLTISLPVALG